MTRQENVSIEKNEALEVKRSRISGHQSQFVEQALHEEQVILQREGSSWLQLYVPCVSCAMCAYTTVRQSIQ